MISIASLALSLAALALSGLALLRTVSRSQIKAWVAEWEQKRAATDKNPYLREEPERKPRPIKMDCPELDRITSRSSPPRPPRERDEGRDGHRRRSRKRGRGGSSAPTA